MKKSKIILIMASLLTVVVTGCGNQIPDLTQEETKMVSEYAAALLLSYDVNYSSKLNVDLVGEDDIIDELDDEPVLEQPIETPQLDVDTDLQEEEEIPTITTPSTIEGIYEIEGLIFEVENVKVAKSCSENGIEEGMLSFIAMDGKELVIVEITGENILDTDIELNMIEKNPYIYIEYENVKRNAQTTMLINDFTTYLGNIEAHSTQNFVIVAEFDEGLVTDTSKISIVIQKNGESFLLEI